MAPEDATGQGRPGGEAAAGAAPRADRAPNLRTALLILVGVILLGWALRAMGSILVPLVAAVLIALGVMPVRDWVRERVPSWLGWLGIAAAMTLILLVIAMFFGSIWFAAQQLVRQLPARPADIVETLQQGGAGEDGQATLAEGAVAGAAEARGETQAEDAAAGEAATEGAGTEGGTAPEGERAEGGGGLLPGTAGQIAQALGDRVAGAAGGVAVTILNSALSIVSGLVIIFFLTLLILVESGEWREKVQAVTRPYTEWQLLVSAEVISGKLRTYLLTRVLIGLITASLYAAWLWFWGVGLVLVWALLTFFLNFIPVVGSLIAGILPVAYALITQDWTTALIVGAGILVIEQVMGNYVDPKIEGQHIALSALVVLVALLFWGWVWGIAGALLAVPVTVSLVVLGAHVPALRPWALMLTDRTTMRGLDEVTQPE